MEEALLRLLSLITVPEFEFDDFVARREAIIDALNDRREDLYDLTRNYVVDELNGWRDGLGDRFDDRLPDDLPDLPGGSDFDDDDE